MKDLYLRFYTSVVNHLKEMAETPYPYGLLHGTTGIALFQF